MTDPYKQLKEALLNASPLDDITMPVRTANSLLSSHDAQADKIAQDKVTIARLEEERDALKTDATRWKEVERRYDNSKTSECERVLEALWLDPKGATKSFEMVIDEALTQGEQP